MLCCVDRHCCLSLAERKDCPSTFGPHVLPTKEWVITQLLDKSQLGSFDRVREKRTKMIQSKEEVKTRPQEVEKRLHESEEASEVRTGYAETMLREVMEQWGRRIEEIERRAREAEDRAREAERKAKLLQQEREVEERLQEVQLRTQEEDTKAQEAEGRDDV